MLKARLVLLVCLLPMTQFVAFAETYRCEFSDGTIVFGDKPVNLSDDCQLIKDDGLKNNIPIYTAPPKPTPPKTIIRIKEPIVRETPVKPDTKSWADRASALVDSYNEAVKKRYHESYQTEKNRAIRKIKEIKAEKSLLLADLAGSSLSDLQKKEVEEILDQIPGE